MNTCKHSPLLSFPAPAGEVLSTQSSSLNIIHEVTFHQDNVYERKSAARRNRKIINLIFSRPSPHRIALCSLPSSRAPEQFH